MIKGSREFTGSRMFNCPEALLNGGTECCMGRGWRQYIRPVCDGTEEYCAPVRDGDEVVVGGRDPERTGTPEALEGF